MNVNDLLNQVADDADAGLMPDPIEIRRAGDRRSARTRRRALIGTTAAALVVAAGAMLLTPGGGDRVEPAPPPRKLLDRVTYMNDDGISFVADDGSRHTLQAKNVDRYGFSPDGQQMAYITYSTNTNTNWLWLADGDGTHRDRQPAPCSGCMPGYGLAWSNDGTRLAYAVLTPGARRPAELRIRTMGTDLEQVYRLPRGCDARGPHFSPDDQSLAINLACAHGQYVATLDADDETSSPTRLTRGYSQVQAPSWSADGRTVYFTATTSGDDTNDTLASIDLFAVGADGTGLRQITHAAAGERYFGPTPYQDRFLIGLARGTGRFMVGFLSADGTNFTPMKGPDGKPIVGNQPQLQP